MFAACALYLAFFLALGLLVTTPVEKTGSSLTSLLILVPDTTAGFVSNFGYDTMS